MLPIQFYVEQFTTLPKPPTGNQLSGKNVIITGANGGLGLEAAYQLAALDPARVILAVRNLEAGRQALDSLLKRFPRLKADVWEVDLAKFSSIKAFAKRAEEELGTVDLLMNNAGVNAGPKSLPPKITDDGHESSHQINALAPVLLLLLLVPALEKSPSPRVVFTTSEVHAWPSTAILENAVKNDKSLVSAMDGQEKVIGFPQYMLAKLCLQMLMRNLVSALPSIKIISVNPGLCRTGLSRNFKFEYDWASIYAVLWVVSSSRSASVGARNLSHAAVGDFESSEYFTCCHPSFAPSSFLVTATGMAATQKYYGEVLEEMEKVAPGCTRSVKKIYV